MPLIIKERRADLYARREGSAIPERGLGYIERNAIGLLSH
jgi:hypothetical protein